MSEPLADGGLQGPTGRLSKPRDELMVTGGFAAEASYGPHLHRGFGLADIAHAVELFVARVVRQPHAGELMRALLELQALDVDGVSYEAHPGDPFEARQRLLAERAGTAAGLLLVGRPRREGGRVAFRIALREATLRAHEALAEVACALVDRAGQHVETVMADHTYLQPAQPITLGYHLLGVADPLLRDLGRLERAFGLINESPAGAGGSGGTSLPINRDRLAASLGFDRAVGHAGDAMWRTDDVAELLFVITRAAVHTGQFAGDLEIYCSPAFGFFDLDDSFVRTSALMPQKRNPYPLSIVRGTAGLLSGRLAGFLSLLRTPSARTEHFILAYREVLEALEGFARTERMMAGVIRTLRVDEEALSKAAEAGFLGAADLVQALALDGDLDYDHAHQLVADLVEHAHRTGGTGIDQRELRSVLAPYGLDDGILDEALTRVSDPNLLAHSRLVRGGTAPERVEEMIEERSRDVADRESWRRGVTGKLAATEEGLVQQAVEIAASAGGG